MSKAEDFVANLVTKLTYGFVFPFNRFLLYVAEGNRWLVTIYELLVWYGILYKFIETKTFQYFYYSIFHIAREIDPIDPFFKALTLWLIPVIFSYVFGISPIYAVLLKIVNGSGSQRNNNFKRKYNENENENENVNDYLIKLISSSDKLAKDVYRRGGVYVFAGIIFSLIGMSFFFTQTQDLKSHAGLTEQVISLAPKFGILIFLELISFFFLKQYRVCMEEFRYFEAIKRSREETLVIVKLVSSNGEKVDFIDLLDKLRFSSHVGRLESGQTTELLEAKKFDKDELEFFAKIIDAVAKKGS